jgi:hypothetical protein
MKIYTYDFRERVVPIAALWRERRIKLRAISPLFSFHLILLSVCKLADWKFETVDMSGQKSRRLVEERAPVNPLRKTLMERRARSTELMAYIILCVCPRLY